MSAQKNSQRAGFRTFDKRVDTCAVFVVKPKQPARVTVSLYLVIIFSNNNMYACSLDNFGVD